MARRKLILPHSWVWMGLWLWASIVVQGLGVSSYADPPPRAALVALAHERDLPAMLFSIRQIEDKFNNQYQYHWVFFSNTELSETFKQQTSNATNAPCIYEVIPHENWNVPGWIDRTRLPPPSPDGIETDPNPDMLPVDARQKHRWNSGLFAHERRLKGYDWFWKIEPGVQLTHDIRFDVFRFMKNNNIAFGFYRDAVVESNLRALSSRVKSFIDKYPELIHKEADVSWLLEGSSLENDKEGTAKRAFSQENSDGLRQRIT